MNKRDFIVAGGGAAVCAAVATPALAAAPPREARRRRPPSLEGAARQATWQRYIGEDFAVEAGAAAGASVRLLRVEAATHPRPGLEQFTLIFGPPAQSGPLALETGTWRLRHATGQRVAIYLDAPTAAAPAGALRAHFSLLA
jgi:hypothetical protein